MCLISCLLVSWGLVSLGNLEGEGVVVKEGGMSYVYKLYMPRLFCVHFHIKSGQNSIKKTIIFIARILTVILTLES